MKSGRRFSYLVLILLLATCAISGCDLFTDPAKQAVAAIDRAIWMIQNESSSWQDILTQTQMRLTSDAKSMMVNEVKTVLNRAIATTGTEFRCNVDFARDRLIHDLVRIQAHLQKEPVPDREPAICLVEPLAVNASRIPNLLKWVEFYGYDFDTTPVQVLLQNGDQYLDASDACLDKSTHYHLTLDLISQGCQLSQTSTRFVLKWGGKEISSIKISQVAGAAVAPAAGAAPEPDEYLGPTSGTGGSEFVDPVPPGARVVGLQIRAKQRVDAIQVILDTGPLSQHGGNGGDLHPITFAEGEYIILVEGRAGDRVDQIAIKTNKRAYGPYGGGGGNPFHFPAPEGYQIIGFFGRSAAELDSVGVILRQRQ